MTTPEQIAGASEDSHSKALMAWCALSLKIYPQLKWFAHIPNGGARDFREGAKFKAMGVRKGIPDYILPYPRNLFAGLWIELKVGKNYPTNEQLEWISYLREVGYKAVVCYGWLEAKAAIEEYLN